MRIEKVMLKHVGPFDDATIEFKRGTNPALADVTLLVGENGTGKSTILYGIADDLTHRGTFGDKGQMGERRHANKFGGATVEPMPDQQANVNTGGIARVDWFAFAYSGTRTFGDVSAATPTQSDSTPLIDALTFEKKLSVKGFSDWLEKTNYNNFKLSTSGTQYVDTINGIANAVSTLLGETIAFDFPPNERPRIKMRERAIPFEGLPSGALSVLTWVTDLLMRHDEIRWANDLPVSQREFLLLLDEIDVHLHPAWQRRLLPFVQQLFPKAQIIATTHSPLVVASADNAQVLVLKRREKEQPEIIDFESQKGHAYFVVLTKIFGVDSEFDRDTKEQLDRLDVLKQELMAKKQADRTEFDQLVKTLASRSEELSQIVGYAKLQLDKYLRA